MTIDYILAYAIINMIANRLNYSAEAIRKGRQSQKLAKVRCIAIHEIKANTGLKNGQIAKIFGCGSHCMVSNRTLVYQDLSFSNFEFKKMARICRIEIL